MGYSILKSGSPMLTGIEDLEGAKKQALQFVTPITGSEYMEIRDTENETVPIGYFDGRRFHWTKDKLQTEAWKMASFFCTHLHPSCTLHPFSGKKRGLTMLANPLFLLLERATGFGPATLGLGSRCSTS